MEEMIIHSELVHPNIIQFLGVAVGRTNVGWLPTGFVLESFPEGSLHNMLRTEREVLPYGFRLEVALQFARSLAYLHGKKIVHFDIKPHNILVRRNFDHVEDTVAKLIDFGFSLKMDGDWLDMSGRSTKRHVWGTRKYAAPELFVDVKNVTEKADVFSFGVTLWKMFTRQSPRNGLSKEGIMQRWINGTMPELRIPSSCEREWAELIRDCTKITATDRPSMDTVVRRISVAKSMTSA
ncbi:hypothetical protein BSKO_13583 [Bryopsis sp. KO-2023]|nr:hypothetical protein BSKO_13583 [Bryopsis sp. KO-2023]